MESKNDEIVSGLRNKIKSIISLYEEQKEKNTQLTTKTKDLTDKINYLEKKIKNTEIKFNNLKLAKVIASSLKAHMMQRLK